MDFVIAAAAGLGLSAACGFRVFVPPLMACIAAKCGVRLLPEHSWLESDLALVLLSVATGLECIGYLVPWFDHLLDTLATPAAAIAGMAMTATTMTGNCPEPLKWGLAIIIGAGSAATVQASTVAIRGTSTATTAGIANPLVAIVESIAAFCMSLLAIVLPIVGGLLAILVLFYVSRKLLAIHRWWKGRRAGEGESMA